MIPLSRFVEQAALREHQRRINTAVIKYQTGSVNKICPDCYLPAHLCRHLPAKRLPK